MYYHKRKFVYGFRQTVLKKIERTEGEFTLVGMKFDPCCIYHSILDCPVSTSKSFYILFVNYFDYTTGAAAFIATVAAKNGISTTEFLNYAMTQIHYILGDNNNNFSYLIGFGDDFPKRPHHRGR